MLCPVRLDIAALDNSPPVVDSDLLKKHVRVDFDDDDALLDVYLRAAIRWCEDVTRRTIFSRAHTWVLRDFELDTPYAIRLPRGRTVSVESVAYSSAGSTVTLYGPSASPVGDDFQEDLRGDDGGVLMPLRGGGWPSVDSDVPAPVTIAFTAGWAADAVPESLLHAILFGVADAYDLRGTQDFNPAMLAAGGARFAARKALVSPYRLDRWY